MSLTYSLRQPRQPVSHAAAIALIAVLHVAAFIAFNNGIGSLIKIISPPPPFKLVEVKPDPIPQKPIPTPDVQIARTQPTNLIPVPDPGPVVIRFTPEVIGTPTDKVTITTDEVVEPVIPPAPKVAILTRVDPAYPAAAQAAGEQGTVLLDVQIDVRGHVADVTIAKSSGFTELDAAAARAVRQWRFSALATNAHVRVPIKFQLNQRF